MEAINPSSFDDGQGEFCTHLESDPHRRREPCGPQALCSRLRYGRPAKVSSGMTEGAGGLRVSRPRSNELISPCGYGAGTLIMGAVAPVIMAVLAVPVWIMFFNV